MKPHLGIPETLLQIVSDELNKLLADEFILYVKMKDYHWNVEGPNFNEIHTFYGLLLRETDQVIESIAKRIRAIGHHAEARLTDYLKLTSLIEQPFTNSQNDQLKSLLAAYETIINNLRRLAYLFADKCKDIGSSYFVKGLLVQHEDAARKIRACFN